jgi:hypothetical protein
MIASGALEQDPAAVGETTYDCDGQRRREHENTDDHECGGMEISASQEYLRQQDDGEANQVTSNTGASLCCAERPGADMTTIVARTTIPINPSRMT